MYIAGVLWQFACVCACVCVCVQVLYLAGELLVSWWFCGVRAECGVAPITLLTAVAESQARDVYHALVIETRDPDFCAGIRFGLMSGCLVLRGVGRV